jgi:dihydrofolate reductase
MQNQTKITIVVAMDNNRAIGKNGDIPWAGKLRDDMEHFKGYTTGKIVVMGRKTYESIPERFRPLPNRENLVLTRNHEIDFPGCAIVHDPLAIERLATGREVCIIGGEEIYRLFLPVVKKAIITLVDTKIEGGDTFFPLLPDSWSFSRKVFKKQKDERNMFSFSVSEYVQD